MDRECQYEQYRAWQETKDALATARSKEQISVFPAVNAARETEQAPVRDEIQRAKRAEQETRQALDFPWER